MIRLGVERRGKINDLTVDLDENITLSRDEVAAFLIYLQGGHVLNAVKALLKKELGDKVYSEVINRYEGLLAARGPLLEAGKWSREVEEAKIPVVVKARELNNNEM